MNSTQRVPLPRTTRRHRGTALLFAGLLALPAIAQQDPQFTQYMFNLLAINPAYAGAAERTEVKALSRHQWVGFEGAPNTQTLTLHAPLFRESLGVGGTIMRDEFGPIQQYNFILKIG